MATLNDTSNVVVIDHKMAETLVWGYQESTIKPHELVSYGQFGKWALQFVDGKGNAMQFGKLTGNKIRALYEVNPQEELEGEVKGKVTGKITQKTGKGVVKQNFLDIAETLEKLCTVDGNTPISAIERWQAAWRVAMLVKLDVLYSPYQKEKYMALAKLDAKMFNFVCANVYTHSPKMLRQQWENDHAPKNDVGKGIVETAKVNAKSAVKAR